MELLRTRPFTTAALLLGVLVAIWSAIPWSGGQKAFFAFVSWYGPNFVLSIAVVALCIRGGGSWRSLWILPCSPLIYIGGFALLVRAGEFLVAPALIVSLVTAYAYLAVIRISTFPQCPWPVVFGWGLLSLFAGLPLLEPVRALAPGGLGSFWFVGLYVLLWYAPVGYAIDAMAQKHGDQTGLRPRVA